jgi:SnoaL-like protein
MARHLVASIVVVLAVAAAAVSAGQSGRPAARTLTTQDYIDIQQLNARYAVAIDECTNNGYDYAALYTDDGWFSPSRNGRMGTKWQGRDRLAEAARGSMKSCDEVPWKGIKHMYVNHVISPSPEGATGRIDLVAIGLDGDPHKVEHQGHYEDVYVKTAKGWLFKSRIHMLAPGQAAVSSGSAPAQRGR